MAAKAKSNRKAPAVQGKCVSCGCEVYQGEATAAVARTAHADWQGCAKALARPQWVATHAVAYGYAEAIWEG